jgi:hypothetical protein
MFNSHHYGSKIVTNSKPAKTNAKKTLATIPGYLNCLLLDSNNLKMTSLNFLKILLILFCPLFSVAQMQFVENKGQWDSKIQYKTDLKAGAFFIEKNGFAIVQHNTAELEKLNGHFHNNETLKNSTDADILHSHAIKVKFIGASVNAIVVPGKQTATYNNYFLGSDKNKWQSHCNIFEEITVKNIYTNIDVKYYSNAGSIKYDFIVHPGGNIEDIVLKYDGADDLSIKNYELHISTSLGIIKESYPYSYQLLNGERKKVDCKYVTQNNKVFFDIKNYNKQSELVIDPTLIFSSFSGSTADNWGNCAAPTPDGSLFSAGIVFATGYPVSAGAFDQTFNGGSSDDANGPYDICIFKFSSNGSSRLYATYLGGSGNEQVHSMICDAQGNLVLQGRTNSPLTSASGGIVYPVTRPMTGAGGLYDIVVTKFNAAGTSLIGSIRMGGTSDDGVNIKGRYINLGVPGQSDGAYDTRRNYGDDNRGDILLDNDNNIYIASCTQSSNFPVSNFTIQSTFGGGGTYIQQDGIIAKFNSDLSTTNFSTYFGGSGNDACINLAINEAAGNLYISGATTSTNLPGNRFNAIAPSFLGGTTDGFITIIKKDGSAIVKTTYEGTAGNDMIYGMQLDKNGYVYITGTTTGTKPVINAAFNQTGGKQFISKLNSDLSGYVYSTNFGTNTASPNICPTAFGIDDCENLYVSGWGGALQTTKQYPNALTTGLTTTSGAIQSSTDGSDFYFFVLEKNANSQLYGSFFGQNGGFTDHCDGSSSRFDANGILYQTICANCGNNPGVVFPTTTGAWATTNGSSGCNQAAIKINLSSGNAVSARLNASKDTTCIATTIVFADEIANARKYKWNFGDGSAETIFYAPSNITTHQFALVGNYTVRLISSDSLSCNLADTVYRIITVNDCTGTQFCNSNIFNLTSNLSGTAYQWQRMRPDPPYSESSFSNLNNNATYSGTNTKTIQLLNAAPDWYGYQFRCIVDGVTSSIIIIKFVSYWTGAIDNQWEVAGNWSCGKIPDAYTDVIVNRGSPVVNSNQSVRSLSVSSGANINVMPGFNLTVIH